MKLYHVVVPTEGREWIVLAEHERQARQKAQLFLLEEEKEKDDAEDYFEVDELPGLIVELGSSVKINPH